MYLDTFTFIQDTEDSSHETVLKQGELYSTWPEVLEQFLIFLEVCYGYPIRDNVDVREHTYVPPYSIATDDDE